MSELRAGGFSGPVSGVISGIISGRLSAHYPAGAVPIPNGGVVYNGFMQ